MNNERDELVSRTYRELDDTRAPDHLNERILRMSAAEAKQSSEGGWRFALWMKPVAWAATIGLSLAIVLEMTQVPTGAPTEIPVESRAAFAPEPASTGTLEHAESEFSDELERAETMARQQTGSNQVAPAEAVQTQKAARRTNAPSPALTDADAVVSEAKEKLEEAVIPASDKPAARKLSADQTVVSQMAEIEPGAREDRANGAMSSLAMTAPDSGMKCDARTRASAERWRECIESLRATGATDIADLEFEAYILEYPDEPEPNK